MYRVLQRGTLAWVTCVLVGVSFGLSYLMYWPGSDFALWRRTLIAVPGVFTLVTFALGATPLWRKLWRLVPILSKWVFPDLNGEWHTVMHSNFPVIAKNHPDFVDVEVSKINAQIPGKFEIVQNWFSIRIRFDSIDRYTRSNTLVVQPSKDPETGRMSVSYIYKAETINPKPTDEQSHFGSAVLDISPDCNELRGPYWTNRNHTKGLNTAGTLVATRADSIAAIEKHDAMEANHVTSERQQQEEERSQD